MQNNSDTSDDEVSLSELWQVLVRYKWWVLGMPAIAMVMAFFVTNLMKPQWEATALVQVGQVGQVGTVGGLFVESASRAVERMKQESFQQNVFSNLARLMDRKGQDVALFWDSLYRNSLKFKVLPNASDLIEIKVRGYSPAEAKRFADATVGSLRNIHDKLAAPTIQHLHQKVAQIGQQIAQVQAERGNLLKIARGRRTVASEHNFMESIVLSNQVIQQDEAMRGLERAKITYEEQLNPQRTYSTSLVENISVSEKPVAPKKLLISVLAGILGLFVGIFTAFVLNIVQLKKRDGG